MNDAQQIDKLIHNAVFAGSEKEREEARVQIRGEAKQRGIYLASIQTLYEAMGRGEISGFTVPAINLRGLTYESARAVFKAAKSLRAGAFIFELARSEIGYTFQRPVEYASVILAAAVREGHKGPVFIQGDHYQVNAKKFNEGGNSRAAEIQALKDLIAESLRAGYRNIDIDTSTIVDLSQPAVKEQQENNFTVVAELTAFIRSFEQDGAMISIGGEIGEVGKKNSTPEEFRAYMEGFLQELKKLNPLAKGLSKISVQTGTSHGGVVLPDGSIAKVKIDFGVLKKISRIARAEYGMAGAVQHGASTLPAEAFHEFPQAEAAEVHLATEFQNIIFDHPSFPQDLKDEMYVWLEKECADERKSDMTSEQFFYKTRKRVWGPFKERVWSLDEPVKAAIRKALEKKFVFLFEELKVVDTINVVKSLVKS